MFTPRRSRCMRLAVVSPAFAAAVIREWAPSAIHAPDRLLAMRAADADHHGERRCIAKSAHRQGLPAQLRDKEYLREARAEHQRKNLENVELRPASQLRQTDPESVFARRHCDAPCCFATASILPDTDSLCQPRELTRWFAPPRSQASTPAAGASASCGPRTRSTDSIAAFTRSAPRMFSRCVTSRTSMSTRNSK